MKIKNIAAALVFIIATFLFSGSIYASFSTIEKLLPVDGAVNDNFGRSVSISGDYAIVGADQDDDHGASSGSAYIFKRIGDNWVQQEKLTASDGAAYDAFGRSVSISGDYAVVGAYENSGQKAYMGAAYIFKRIGGDWVQQKKLTADDGRFNDHFGFAVSIFGEYTIVGALHDDVQGPDSGSAYIFKRIGEDWVQQEKLTPNDGVAYNTFGSSVSIFEDYAIVGADLDDVHGSDAGSAYIFKRTGDDWVQQTKLTANDAAYNDHFGYSVSIFGDYAIVGANDNDDQGSSSGSAYLFKRTGDNWNQKAKLTANDGAAEDYFGCSVSLSGDYAVVGAYGDNDQGSDAGSAYLFKRIGDNWIQQEKLMANDGFASDWFGYSAAVSGQYVIAGAYRDDDNGSNAGSAYIFDLFAAQIGLPSSMTIEKGDSVYFKGTASGGKTPYTYWWDFGSILKDPGYITFDTAGVYPVVFYVQSGDGFLKSDSVTITVKETGLFVPTDAIIDTVLSDVAIQQGETVNLTGSVYGSAVSFSFWWNFGNGNTSASEDPGPILFASPGSYTVTFYVQDNIGDVASDTLTVIVTESNAHENLHATIEKPLTNPTVVAGGSVDFAGSGRGGSPPYSYWWQFDTMGGSQEENPGPITFGMPGTYSIHFYVQDSSGTVASDSISVAVTGGAAGLSAIIETPFESDTIAPGGSVSLTGSVSGGLPPYLYWWDFGSLLGGSALEDPGPVTFNTSGNYTIVFYAQDSLGNLVSDTVAILVSADDSAD